MAKQRGRIKKKKAEEGLIITSLIDVFTILVVFLLKNFSAEGNLVSNAENLTLPQSNSKQALKEVNLQIAITSDMILVDNVPVSPFDVIKKIPRDDPDPIVPGLHDELKRKYAMEEEMVRIGAQNKVEGKAIIQVDKNIPFDVVYKIINTCGKVGYNDMKLAVTQREEG